MEFKIKKQTTISDKTLKSIKRKELFKLKLHKAVKIPIINSTFRKSLNKINNSSENISSKNRAVSTFVVADKWKKPSMHPFSKPLPFNVKFLTKVSPF